MTTLLNLDTYRSEIVDDTNYHVLSPTSSVFSAAGDSDSRISTSSSPRSVYSQYSDSSNAFNMESMNISQHSVIMEVDASAAAPFLEIIEQPLDKFRFRYKSEMHGTHGSLTGQATSKMKRSFPSVRLHNFNRPAIIQCSLFQTDTINLMHHSHSLVVRKDNDDIKDPHSVEISPNHGYTAVFQGMGIIHTAKKYIADELYEKLVNRMTFEKSRDVTTLEKAQLRIQAEKEAKHMNLNQVCLCFEAFECVGPNWISICDPVLSNPINNMKSALTGELKITRLSSDISEAGGGDDLFLFVEKVGKKNIKVRFFETDENDEPIWEDWGRFSETDVHHQYAIALRTPPYVNKDIEENVDCWIQLVRPTDKCYSDRIKFRYKPRRTTLSRKRARMSSAFSSAELPAIINNFEGQTISTEYNKSKIIDEFVNSDTESIELAKEEYSKFFKHISVNLNTEDLLAMFDPNLFIDSKELNQDLSTMLATDSATTKLSSMKNQSSNQLGPELLLPLMQKIMIRNSKDIAADKIRNLFTYEYDNDRCILDFLITHSMVLFKYFLNLVEKLDITDVLNYQNRQKKSCFHLVCENCEIESILEMFPNLIRLGVDPNLTDDKGDTVLHLLIRENMIKCVKIFLNSIYPKETKLNLEIRNDDSLTPLLLAARLKRIEIVEMLLKAGASVAVVNSKDGNNILHIAVNENSGDLVELLLKRSQVDVTLKNNTNKMPIDLAEDSPNREILTAFKKYNQLSVYTTNENKDNNSDEETSDTETICNQFEESMNFLTNKYPNEINTEPCDTYPESNILIDESHDDAKKPELFDEICLEQLCKLFNRSDKWRKLAELLDVTVFVGVWAASKNPSKMMFKFVEVQETELGHIIDIFKQLNDSSAITLIDEMIARRLENDDE